MKRKLEATVTLLSRKMLRLPWRIHIIKEEFKRKIGTKMAIMHVIRKQELYLYRHILTKVALENLTHIGHS